MEFQSVGTMADLRVRPWVEYLVALKDNLWVGWRETLDSLFVNSKNLYKGYNGKKHDTYHKNKRVH